jgi:hypothetical protein
VILTFLVAKILFGPVEKGITTKKKIYDENKK